MTADAAAASLGTRPNCGDVVPRACPLVEADQADGAVGQFAGCPPRRAVIHSSGLEADERSRAAVPTPGSDSRVRSGGETDG